MRYIQYISCNNDKINFNTLSTAILYSIKIRRFPLGKKTSDSFQKRKMIFVTLVHRGFI